MLVMCKEKVNALAPLTVVDFAIQYEKEMSQVKKCSCTWKRLSFCTAKYCQNNGDK